MRRMRGLTIVVADASPERFRTTLNLALAAAALGSRVRVFLDGAAVALLRPPIRANEDAAYVAAGLPGLATLCAEALDAGIRLILCQTGLAMTGAEAHDHDARVEFAGMVSLLADLGEDRLVVV